MMLVRLGQEPSGRRRLAAVAPIFGIAGHSGFGQFKSRIEAKNFPCSAPEFASQGIAQDCIFCRGGRPEQKFFPLIPV
jgi:hypothetical protein